MINILDNIKVNVRVTSNTEIGVYILTPEQSLAVMIQTALGSRVGRPTFGSTFYTLVDKNINDLWVLKAKKSILECTRCSITGKLWDSRVDIKNLNMSIVDDTVDIGVEL